MRPCRRRSSSNSGRWKPSARASSAYRALIEPAPDAIVTLDWRGRVSSTNGVSCGIQGYTPEEVVGKPFWKLGVFRVQDIPKYIRLFVSLLRGKPMAPIELVCLSKDGTEVVIECRASVMRNGGKVAGLQLISRNVTELKKAEQALRESEQTLRATLESTADGILVVTEGGKIKHFNERFVRMWGFPAELMEARDEAPLLQYAAAQLQDPQAFLHRAGSLPATVGQETYVVHFKDGRIFERFSCPLVRDGRKVGHVASYRDVTAKRQAERLAAIGEMAAGLAHENRNAMQRMQACLEMLALEVQDCPEALDLLNRMQVAQDRLYHLHEEVREYAAPIMLNCQPLCLDQVVHEAWRQLELEAARSARTVQFRCFAGLAAISLDRLALESVFRNIFENSLAACPDPVEVDVRSGPATLNGLRGPGDRGPRQRSGLEPRAATADLRTVLHDQDPRHRPGHGHQPAADRSPWRPDCRPHGRRGRRRDRHHPAQAMIHVFPIANSHCRRRTRHA